MIKIDRLETHDRYETFTNQSNDIAECIQDFINKRPFGAHPFYLFAHGRLHENGKDTRLIWHPRLSRPKPQTNSMLFKVYPGTDIVKIFWQIPARELWEQYKEGNVCANENIWHDIQTFIHNRLALEKPEDDDLTDEQASAIYVEISAEAKRNKMMSNIWLPS